MGGAGHSEYQVIGLSMSHEQTRKKCGGDIAQEVPLQVVFSNVVLPCSRRRYATTRGPLRRLTIYGAF